jgi:hypothetical protein
MNSKGNILPAKSITDTLRPTGGLREDYGSDIRAVQRALVAAR